MSPLRLLPSALLLGAGLLAGSTSCADLREADRCYALTRAICDTLASCGKTSDADKCTDDGTRSCRDSQPESGSDNYSKIRDFDVGGCLDALDNASCNGSVIVVDGVCKDGLEQSLGCCSVASGSSSSSTSHSSYSSSTCVSCPGFSYGGGPVSGGGTGGGGGTGAAGGACSSPNCQCSTNCEACLCASGNNVELCASSCK